MNEVRIRRTVLDYQEKIFADRAKYVMIKKGRRLGFTRGAAEQCIEWLLEGVPAVLWGDTTHANIKRYYQGYFLPILKKLPRKLWKYNASIGQLQLAGNVLDFRSAERPENWEGFGYKKIILNEAGIILSDRYLYENAILPMMLDYSDSQLFAGGVPKGEYDKSGRKHLFYELCEKAEKGQKGFSSHHYTSFDNPILDPASIEQLIIDLGGEESPVVRQEVFGQFVNIGGTLFFWAYNALKHKSQKAAYLAGLPVWASFDFNYDQMAVVLGQQLNNRASNVIDIITVPNGDTNMACAAIKSKYPSSQFIVTGDASGAKHDTRNSHINDYRIIKKLLSPIKMFVRKQNLSIENSYALCNTVLSSERVEHYIAPHCDLLLSDIGKGRFKEKAGYELVKDRLNNKLDHFDAYRYLLDAWYSPMFSHLIQ